MTYGSRRHFATGKDLSESGGTHSVILGVSEQQRQLGLGVSIHDRIDWFSSRKLIVSETESIFSRQGLTVNHFHFCLSMFQILFHRPKIGTESDLNLFHFHGPWSRESAFENRESRYKLQIKKVVERMALRLSDHVLVASESFAHFLENDFGVHRDKISVIGLGVDTDLFKPWTTLSKNSDKYRIGTVRRLVPRMGLENLILAMKYLDDFKLEIVGSGPLREELEKLISKNNLDNKVTLLGSLKTAELPKFYSSLDLCVVPSIALEGFCLTALEAFACGVPVIGSNLGGLKDSIGSFSYSHLFDPNSVDAIVATIKSEVWRKPNIRKESRIYAERNSWKARVDQIETLIRNGVG